MSGHVTPRALSELGVSPAAKAAIRRAAGLPDCGSMDEPIPLAVALAAIRPDDAASLLDLGGAIRDYVSVALAGGEEGRRVLAETLYCVSLPLRHGGMETRIAAPVLDAALLAMRAGEYWDQAERHALAPAVVDLRRRCQTAVARGDRSLIRVSDAADVVLHARDAAGGYDSQRRAIDALMGAAALAEDEAEELWEIIGIFAATAGVAQ